MRPAIIAGGAIALLAGAAGAGELKRFVVAEDHTRFVFDEAPVHDDGMPAYGASFVTQGYIYPAGTLAGESGVEADGAPAYPDKVIGTWTCTGWFVGDGAHTQDGAWVMSRQVYAFEDGGMLISHGPELSEPGAPVRRPVTGATGAYGGTGAIRQTLMGFHDHGGVQIRFAVVGQ